MPVRQTPNEWCLHLAPIRRISATRLRIIGTMNFFNLACFLVLHKISTANDVTITQTTSCPAPCGNTWARHFTEIVPVNVNYITEGHLTRAGARILRIIGASNCST